MENQITLLTRADIESRVTSTNKFSKDEILVHRKEITAARKSKRERLKQMTVADVSATVGKAMEQGFHVRDSKTTHLKTGDKVTIELFKPLKSQKKLSVENMSASEIVAALGDKAAQVFQAMAAAKEAQAAIESEA